MLLLFCMSPSDGVGPSGMNKVLLNRIEFVFGATVLVYKSNSFLAVKCVYMSVKCVCVCVCVCGRHTCIACVGAEGGMSSMLYLLFYTVYFDRTVFFSVILLLLLMSLGAV